MKADPPQSTIIAGIIPEFPIGTVVEIKNNVDTIPIEDRLAIVRECLPKELLSDKPYIAYNVELVSKPGVFRLRTKQFLKAANMPTKQPVPPPKFNINDQVMCNGRRFKITNRNYNQIDWFYDIKVIEVVDGFITEINSIEGNLTLAPPPQKTPPQPEPKYKQGQRVLCGPPEDVVYIRAIHSFSEMYRWRYAIDRYSGTNISKLIDQADHIPEDSIKPYSLPPENNTTVNEQGGRQSHLDARFDCIPPVVLRLLAQCLGFGARKYGKDNWKKIPQWDHLNHAVNHINEWNRGNRDEPHLVNAMARLTFALWQAVDSKDQPDTYIHPDDTK
jgi:hypothetical protein